MTKKKMQVVIGGAGGQGILTTGKVISYACINKNLNVSCLPAYGAEMRGGYVYCILTISNSDEVYSPVSSECDMGIFMNEKSFHMLSSYLKKNGIIIINSSLIKTKKENSYQIPATEEAEKIGDVKVANMVIAGFLIPFLKKEFSKFEKEDMFYGIDRVIKKDEMKRISKKAIEIGLHFRTGF